MTYNRKNDTFTGTLPDGSQFEVNGVLFADTVLPDEQSELNLDAFDPWYWWQSLTSNAQGVHFVDVPSIQ